MEALVLADHAGYWAKTITKIKDGAVEELDLDGFEPVPEVQGLADTWWRGKDSLTAVYRGEASGFDAPTASGPKYLPRTRYEGPGRHLTPEGQARRSRR